MAKTTDQTRELRDQIAGEAPSLVEIRHRLHRIPELGYQEQKTSNAICHELDRLGIVYRAGLAGGTGVVAHLPATEPGARHATGLRADIDALPISERTGKPYASEHPGLMHACGHDGHTTILLGAARLLSQTQHRPNPVTFVFQPAEEGGAGGEKMCDDGALLGEQGGGLGPPVARMFGLHGWPQIPLGTISTRPGPLLAATDDFEVHIVGMQTHAAFPHLGRDAIVASAHVVNALQSIASRSVSPLDSVIVTVGAIQGGTTNNVIPERVKLIGTVRTLHDATRTRAREEFERVVTRSAETFGCRAEIDYQTGYPVTYNDPELTDHVLHLARETFGEKHVEVTPEACMGGEDFSYYGRHVPACFYLLGVCPIGSDPATIPQLHQPEFDFNDEAIPVGVEMMCRLALS